MLSLKEQAFQLNKMRRLRNQVIVKVTGEGCQAISEFQWVGKVKGFKWDKEEGNFDVIIRILKHHRSYGDARDEKEEEIYTYPMVNNDIQYVEGVWILYT
jgi:hypothetical protein